MNVVTEIPDLIWSGDQEPIEEEFHPVRNSIRPVGKPHPSTGMWLCPATSEYRWTHWSEENTYQRGIGLTEWKLTVRPGTRLAVIDCYEDLLEILRDFGIPYQNNPYLGMTKMFSLIDFELMSQHYDGIWLTENGERETRYSEPSLYGWDLESVLAFRWIFDNVSVEAEVTEQLQLEG